LTRTVQSDNSIIKTIKTTVIIHSKKNSSLILAMFKRSRITYDIYVC